MVFLAQIHSEIIRAATVNSIVVLSALLVVSLAVFLFSAVRHHRRKMYLIRETPAWNRVLDRLQCGEIAASEAGFRRPDLERVKNLIVMRLYDAGIDDRERLRVIYRELGFLEDDINLLERGSWPCKVRALERLEDLAFEEAGQYILKLLADRRPEVRFSALKALAESGSTALPRVITDIFEDTTRWAYRYIVSILAAYRLPEDSLRPLAESDKRDFRKAAAQLLGYEGADDSVPFLEELATDDIKDVRREAVRSLGRIKTKKAVHALSAKAGDIHPQVRKAVAMGLSALFDAPGAEAMIPAVKQLASDKDFDVRLGAFYALACLGEPGRDVIRSFEEEHPEMANEFLLRSHDCDAERKAKELSAPEKGPDCA